MSLLRAVWALLALGVLVEEKEDIHPVYLERRGRALVEALAESRYPLR